MSKIIKTILERIFDSSKCETKGFNHQIALFATLNFFGHLISINFKHYLVTDSKNILYLDVIITLFSFILIFHNNWPRKFSSYQSIYWHLFLILTLPLYFGCMLLYNPTFEWQLNFLFAISFLTLFCNWKSFMIITIMGMVGSYGFYTFSCDGSIIFTRYFIFIIIASFLLFTLFLYKDFKSENNEYIRLTDKMEELSTNYNLIIEEKTIEFEKDLESRTALLQDVSHEIRSPLHGIMALSDILYKDWGNIQEEERKAQILNISEASSKLTHFINELLDFSKFKAGRMIFNFEKMNLTNSINEVIEDCRKLYLFQKKLSINFENNKITEALIYGDKYRISQLIMNLFTNSIKYTEEGTITAILKLINFKGKSCWEFSLIDQGIGIPDEDLENIFIPFNQSNREKERKIGTGLGLAICKQIIEAHEGEIWAENNKNGKGAKFTFIIPALKT